MGPVAAKPRARSLPRAVARVWREEGWPGLAVRLQARIPWLRLRPPANPPPPSPGPDWITIGGSPESFARLIALPPVREPLISVVFRDPRRVRDVLGSLAAIARHCPDPPSEAIVVDDDSPAEDSRVFALVENLVYFRGEDGHEFARSVNAAARRARGRFLLFVGGGVQVQPGCLRELVGAFDDPRVAIAGAKMIARTGRIEEAWAVVRGDGRVERIGRDDDPGLPLYARKRNVDYCTGASVMIPRELFLDAGGFDEAMDRSCVEDLSLRLRTRGRAVVYVPEAVVVRGAEEGPPEAPPSRVEVSPRLLERWREAIAREERVRTIAFYLPQYHPIPENDAWWGRGFTEWTNVARAKSLYPGHLQPRVPADLGFYDLRLPEAREAQAALAAAHGLSGFCYYYYWFHGKRLLDRPLVDMLEQGKPDFPFCLCWANENWTRRWDGREAEVLIGQEHSPDDDERFIRGLLRFFEDERYIRVDGRPLLLLYRARLLPDLERTAAIWRRTARMAGVGDLYLAAVQSFDTGEIDPRTWGFDAAVEFPPHGYAVPTRPPKGAPPQGQYFDYPQSASNFSARPLPAYPLFRTAMPSWDNSPRRRDRAHIFVNDSAEAFERWLRTIVTQTRHVKTGDERIVFINAWNEWAEGNYLEPDQERGRSYLEATARALGIGPP
jgi:GT2 family glycosyltransferase